MEAAIALTIFDKILNVLGLVKEGNLKRDEQIDAALSKIHRALVDTQAYALYIKSSDRLPERESELALLWYESSRTLRNVDADLAMLCHVKGGYWSNPDAWEEAKSGGYDIALANVEHQIRELLAMK